MQAAGGRGRGVQAALTSVMLLCSGGRACRSAPPLRPGHVRIPEGTSMGKATE